MHVTLLSCVCVVYPENANVHKFYTTQNSFYLVMSNILSHLIASPSKSLDHHTHSSQQTSIVFVMYIFPIYIFGCVYVTCFTFFLDMHTMMIEFSKSHIILRQVYYVMCTSNIPHPSDRLSLYVFSSLRATHYTHIYQTNKEVLH